MSPDPDKLFQEAVEHHRAGDLPKAAVIYQQILQAQPENVNVLYLLGLVAFQAGQGAHTVELLRRAVAIDPGQASCHGLLGAAAMTLGMKNEAEEAFRRAIDLDGAAEHYNGLGVLLKEQGRLQEAIAAFRQANEKMPETVTVHCNLGYAYREQGDLVSAAECFGRVVELEPDNAAVLGALGQILHRLAHSQEAVPFLERAIALNPGDADCHCDLGDALQTLGRIPDAVAAYGRAIQLNPKLGRAWYSAGCAEASRKEFVAAVSCFRQALELQPNWPEAQHNLGQVLFKLGQVDEALQLFRRAVSGSDASLSLSAIAVVIPGSPSSSNQDILDARRSWAESYIHEVTTSPRPLFRRASRGGPLRIGYVSSFFADHNWMKPVWGLINQHDRTKFRVHLFSDGPAARIQHGYRPHADDRFFDTARLLNEALADQIRDAGIDLLVDLNGYSTMGRLPLFAMRPAPVIVGWFNMYATTGIAGYDYLIGDDVVIPPSEEKFYSEKILRAPGSYLTFEVNYPVPDVVEPPSLKNGAVTFGCLASQYKITGQVVAAWSGILQQTPGSALVLKSGALASQGVREFVLGLFEVHGVARERIRLYGPSDHYRFLETYGEIDIALDTFPYNGGTTTTEAIWQGVPLATFYGDRWVSRTSASILKAAGLDEYIAGSVDEYVSLAVRLASSPDQLRDARLSMRSRLGQSAVCDTVAFARRMEQMYQRAIGRAQ